MGCVFLHRTLSSCGCDANLKHDLQLKICQENGTIAAGPFTGQISIPQVAQAELRWVQWDSLGDWRKSRKLQELKKSLGIFVHGFIGRDGLQNQGTYEVAEQSRTRTSGWIEN